MNDLFFMLLLIVVSGLLAISEIAIAAAGKIRLRVMADEGDLSAARVLSIQQDPGRFIAMIQIGLNGVAIMGGIVGEQTLTPCISALLGMFYQGELLPQISFVVSFLLLTSLFILFADLLPKRIGMLVPEAVAIKVVSVISALIWLLTPLVVFFNSLTNGLLRLLKLPARREDRVTTDDIVAMMDAGAEYGSLQQQEYQLIGNVFELENRTLPSAMTSRDQIVFFDQHDSTETISARIIEHPHNWFLVCDGSLDKVIGAVDSKEILRRVLQGEKARICAELISRELLFLPDTLTLAEGFNAFRSTLKPFAVVLNEYGLVVGILTVRDLLNTLMGDLLIPSGDEQIIQRDADSWLVDGSTPVVDLARVLELDTEDFPDNSQYETVAGFLIYQLKKIPKRADYVLFHGYKFEAIDIDNLRVDQLLVSRTDTRPVVAESPMMS